MSRPIMLVPIGTSVGLTSVCLGLVRAFQQQGIKVNFFKPVSQTQNNPNETEQSTAIISHISQLDCAQPLDKSYVEKMLGENNLDTLLEDIIGLYEQYSHSEEIVVIEGLVTTQESSYAIRLNNQIANALDAQLVLVTVGDVAIATQLNDKLEIATDSYGGHKNRNLLGCIFNKINAPEDTKGRIAADLYQLQDHSNQPTQQNHLQSLPIFNKQFAVLGCIPWSADLMAPRVIDLCRHLNARMINQGDYQHRRLRSVHFCAREIQNMLPVMQPGALLVLSGDRTDVLITACYAALSGTKIGALLLTGGYQIAPEVLQFVKQALDTGLPIMLTNDNTWQTSLNLHYFDHQVPADDLQRIDRVMEHIAANISKDWIRSLSIGSNRELRLSPPAFRYKLTMLARQANKRIVLPEGNEPRTIKAAAICAQRQIAQCILLGESEEVFRIAKQQGVTLPPEVQIIAPNTLRDKYIAPMLELRKHKGLTDMVAVEQLLDNVVLGTMMLQQGDVDGLVSGAVNTTANTIRPALQLIKTAPGATLVSSVFFMLLPEQVLVYGDCAINPDPDDKQLADIAIQSADSAKMFGIPARIAMISYSTGNSGHGADVDKVKRATAIVKNKRPDLIIDGPLQYDAAIIESVAKQKAPNSPVAGQATIFIFPDLNTGNTTYKAVQRSANLLSIGPMLQGMAKPVNDLSRGALVEDIVYTIALTAIQASHTINKDKN